MPASPQAPNPSEKDAGRWPPPGARLLMYTSALAGVLAVFGMWNLMSGRQKTGPRLRHVVAIGEFGGEDGGERLRTSVVERLANYPDLELQLSRAGEAAGSGGEFLLDGTLRRQDDAWELAARLLDLDEARVLWSDRWQFKAAGLERTSERLAEAVARSLKVSPGRAPEKAEQPWPG